jgi:hypothetical protein
MSTLSHFSPAADFRYPHSGALMCLRPILFWGEKESLDEDNCRMAVCHLGFSTSSIEAVEKKKK